MQTNGAIFDLLLGSPQTDPAATQQMLPFGQSESGISFENLLGQLAVPAREQASNGRPFMLPSNHTVANQGLGMGDVVTSDESAQNSSQPFSLLAEMFSAGKDTAQVPSYGSQPQAVDELIPTGNQSRGAANPANEFVALSDADPFGLKNASSIDPDTEWSPRHDFDAASKDVDDTEVQRLLGVLSRPVAINESRTNALPNGTYEVLGVEAKGNQVELTLKNPDLDTAPIKLSLPQEVAQKIVEQAVSQMKTAHMVPARVAMQQSESRPSELVALLQKLQVKELTIKSGDAATGDDALDATPNADKKIIEFHGQPDGKHVNIDLTVPRRSLTVRMPVKPGVPTDADAPLFDKPGQRPTPAQQATSTIIAGKGAEPTSWPTRQFTGFSFDKSSADMKIEGDLGMTNLTSLRTPAESQPTSLQQQVQVARFTLPENLAQQYKANGRSITIGIEPEHLGPARLHLSVHNHSLTARLTVESSAAKSIVEQSLDQLSQQLDRAGIKVDSISVQVAGGDTNTNMFEQRQQAAFTRSRLSGRMTERIINQELNAVTETPIPSRSTYVGPGGVNVFA